jgi:diadenylate cyclase
MRLLAWMLQILILAAGIHLFLRFVRTTRGNRLIRGLFLAVIVGVVGLWGLSTSLGLEELEHLLESSTGFIVVGFAIIFQSELRRGIAQLGERSFLSKFMHSAGNDSTREVVQAAKTLSGRRQGALIVFERETPLHTYIQTGTTIDADVRASLIESLFHPGTPLHDGAVILRKDRIAAAGCILPLAEDAVLEPTMGTRHRAGLGLTEESDAVVLIVSEETGSISLARGGTLCADLPHVDLERELGEVMQGRENHEPHQTSLLSTTVLSLRRDVAWLPGSLLLAWGILYVAHRGIQETIELPVRIVDGHHAGRSSPRDGEILVLLAGERDRLVGPEEEIEVAVTGTRRQLDELGGSVRGVVEIDEVSWEGGELAADDVRWEAPVGGIDYRWPGRLPELLVERYDVRRFVLQPSCVDVDTTRLNPRYQVLLGALRFEPGPNVAISGPAPRLAELGDKIRLRLERIVASPDDREELRARINLSASLTSKGFALAEETPVEVVVPIVPVVREIGSIAKEIALVSLDPKRTGELQRWALPPNGHSARFAIETSGLIPLNADPASPAMIERFGTIRRFVEDNLCVFVDVAEISPETEGRSAPIRWTWRRDWRESLESLKLEGGTLGDREQLDVRLESDAEVLLEQRPMIGSGAPRRPGENH